MSEFGNYVDRLSRRITLFITLGLLSDLIHQPVFATSHINIFSSACLFLFSDGYDTPCCKDCLYTNTTGTKCRDADPTNCQDNTYCDGKSPRCPSAPSMRDGTRCIDGLVCRALCLMYSFLIWQGVVKHDFTQRWSFVPPGTKWKVGDACCILTQASFLDSGWPIPFSEPPPDFSFSGV